MCCMLFSWGFYIWLSVLTFVPALAWHDPGVATPIWRWYSIQMNGVAFSESVCEGVVFEEAIWKGVENYWLFSCQEMGFAKKFFVKRAKFIFSIAFQTEKMASLDLANWYYYTLRHSLTEIQQCRNVLVRLDILKYCGLGHYNPTVVVSNYRRRALLVLVNRLVGLSLSRNSVNE